MKMNEPEVKFLEFLENIPSIKSEDELLGTCMVTMNEMATKLLDSNLKANIPITAAAAYLAVVIETYVKGCKDVEMASLSAKTHMIDKFKKQYD